MIGGAVSDTYFLQASSLGKISLQFLLNKRLAHLEANICRCLLNELEAQYDHSSNVRFP